MKIENIHKSIPEKELSLLKKIISKFQNGGFQCYLVGGSVRDLVLGNSTGDFDFATDARPDDVIKLFKKVIPTGIKHGTVTLLVDDLSVEVTTFRSDGKYIDGRRPEEVYFSDSLDTDVKRRDFTINGLAYDFSTNKILDYVGGLDDIRLGMIRTIGEPHERFGEDGLRPYRACRFASKLGFAIHEDTFAAISDTLDIAAVVSPERVRDEFIKILESETPSVGIEYLRESGLLKLMLPELDSCYGVSQNRYHTYDIYHHSIYSADSAPRERPLLRLAALLHDIGKLPTRRMSDEGDYTFYNHEVVGAKITRKLMKRLKFSNDDISYVNNLILNHMFHFTDEWTDGAVRRFMRKVGVEYIDDIFLLRLADRKGTGSRGGMPAPIKKLIKRIDRIIEDENAITVKDLDINGKDLIEELDLKQGPVIGKILHELLEVILDDPEKNRRDVLIELAKEIMAENENDFA
jgi:poly(A) polymerase/tRNA nucleotidyltransferase (CCA-adding enzyme)